MLHRPLRAEKPAIANGFVGERLTIRRVDAGFIEEGVEVALEGGAIEIAGGDGETRRRRGVCRAVDDERRMEEASETFDQHSLVRAGLDRAADADEVCPLQRRQVVEKTIERDEWDDARAARLEDMDACGLAGQRERAIGARGSEPYVEITIGGIESAMTRNAGRGHGRGIHDRGVRVERGNDAGVGVRWHGNDVRHGHLARGVGARGEHGLCVFAQDRDDPIGAEAQRDVGVAGNRHEDRGRIGGGVRLDDDAAERWDSAVVEGAQEALQAVGEAPRDGAADAAGTQRDELVLGLLDQRAFQRGRPEIIKDYSGLGEGGIAEEAVDEGWSCRRLSGRRLP
ncbi:MAG: hypothetical protein WDM84_09340 [Bauldia sp.]